MTLFVARMVTPYTRSEALSAVVDAITVAVHTTAAVRFNAAMQGSEFDTFPSLAQDDISVESLRHDPDALNAPPLEVELCFGDHFNPDRQLNIEPFAQVLTDAFISVVGTAAMLHVEASREAGLTSLAVGTRLPRPAGVGILLGSGMFVRSWGSPNRASESLSAP